MVVKLRKIVKKGTMFYTEKGYLDAVIKRNTDIINAVHQHGINLKTILFNIRYRKNDRYNNDLINVLETKYRGRAYRWSDWTYRCINRYLYSLEKGFVGIDVSYRGAFKRKNDLFVRPYMPLERDVLRQNRLYDYTELFNILYSKSYVEFIKKAHSRSCKPVNLDLRLKF